jgi:hypothetical protein
MYISTIFDSTIYFSKIKQNKYKKISFLYRLMVTHGPARHFTLMGHPKVTLDSPSSTGPHYLDQISYSEGDMGLKQDRTI